ncbi:MAG: cohesin domain-containing protein [Candidatus Bathyarchaeota archaeon]|nr:cohesin domain-containing protein [Candidatus Bathyarchaeota archaeon]
MKYKLVTGAMLTLLFIGMLTLAFNTQLTEAQPATTVYVDPPISAKDVTGIDQEFTVAIRIAQVQFLYSWRFDLEWNSSLLEIPDNPETPGIVEGISEGTFLNKEGEFQTTFVLRLFDGRVSVTCSLKGVAVDAAPSGSGTLATVTFKVKAEGECPLHFSFTRLTRPTSDVDPILIIISHTAEDGYFQYPLPMLYIEPSSIMDAGLGPGSNFTINIKVAQMTDLYAWNITLYWNPAILVAKNVIEGPFLKSAGTTVFSPPTINQMGGYLNANCTLVDLVPGANGTGTIAYITFQVKAKGQSRISLTLSRPPLPDLDKSELVDSAKALICHATENGYFECTSAPEIFEVVWESQVFHVVIESPSTVSDFAFFQSNKLISFDVNGSSGITSFCNVTIPKELLDGEPWMVKISGLLAPFVEKENETHTFLYFNYTHSTKDIEITGTQVIPEFSSVIILPLFMTLSLITVVFVKHKKK